MGMTVWVLNEDDAEDNLDHSVILAKEKALGKLAKTIGVRKLSEFYDNSILEEEFGAESEPNYSSAEEVEKSLIGIITAINDGRSEKLDKVEGLIEELEDCLSKVKVAKAKNKKVRLAILP